MYKKRAIALIIILSVIFSAVSPVVFATGDTAVIITTNLENQTVIPETEFILTFSIKNNPVIAGGVFSISYNSDVFQITGDPVAGEVIADYTEFYSDYGEELCVYYFGNAAYFAEGIGQYGEGYETNKDGVIFTLPVKIKSDAPNGTYNISITDINDESGSYFCDTDGLFDSGKIITSVTPVTIIVDSDSTTDPPDEKDFPDNLYYAWGYGGEIEPDEDGQYTITATEDNYVIDEIWVNNEKLSDVQGLTEFTTASDDTIEAIFATFAYTVNFNNPVNGTLSVSRGGNPLTSGSIVRGGEVLTITAAPEIDYELDTLTLVGLTQIGSTNTYRVTAEQGEQTPRITASFKLSAPTTPVIPKLERPLRVFEGHIITDNSFIYAAPAPSTQDPDASVQYRIRLADQYSEWSEWQDSPAFYGLTPLTYYEFQTRYVASDPEVWSDSDPSVAYDNLTTGIVAPPTSYAVSAAQPEHGMIYLNSSSAVSGTSIQVTVVPEDGYGVASISYTGGESGQTVNIADTGLPAGIVQRQFNMPDEPATVSAVIEQTSAPPTVTSWTGEGTAASPYLIYTNEDMQSLSNAVNNDAMSFAGKFFSLQNDIDLESWTPIGNYTDRKRFSGTFDGNGHALTIAVQSGKEGSGLFGYAVYGTIENLTVRGTVNSTAYRAGGIVGHAENSTVKNCVNYAAVTGSGNMCGIIGGIAGGYAGTNTLIEDCQNFGNITLNAGKIGTAAGIVGGGDDLNNASITIRGSKNHGKVSVWGNTAGGIIGKMAGNTVIDGCENDALIEVTSGGNAGGIAAITKANMPNYAVIQITNCGNSGAVKSYSGSGGIIGIIDTNLLLEIDSCWNSGYIYGERGVGGIVGQIGNYQKGTTIPAVITNVYNTGEIAEKVYTQDTTAIGGIVGVKRGSGELTLTNAYNAGTITHTHLQYVGGLIGQASTSNVTNSYYLDTLDNAESSGDYGTAKTSDELKSLAGTLGEAFAHDTNVINSGYPIFVWQAVPIITPESYSISIDPAITHGTVSADKISAEQGELITVTVTPDNGYSLKPDSLKQNGTPITPTNGAYSFTMPAEDVTLTAEFNPNPPESYSISIDPAITHGTVSADKISAEQGELITVTVTPDNGYSLKPDSLKQNGTPITQTNGAYSFTMPDEDVTITAEFKANSSSSSSGGGGGGGGGGTPKVEEEAKVPDAASNTEPKQFEDVSSEAWYSEHVSFVSSHGLMTGKDSKDTFKPNDLHTRAEWITVLARLEKAPLADNTQGAWYQPALDWAIELGITDGSEPNAPITREQVIVMLWRLNGSPASTATLSSFADADKVSDWATAAMSWAVERGIITGDSRGLAPKDYISRAEVAAILQRYLTAV